MNKTEQDSRDKSKKKAREETKKAPSEENLEENSWGKWTEVQISRRSREMDSREAEKSKDKAKKPNNEAGIPGLHYSSAEHSVNIYTTLKCNPGKID